MKFKFKCQEENQFFVVEGLLLKPICPNNPSHLIEPNSLLILNNDDNLDECIKDYKYQRKDLINYISLNAPGMTEDELKVAAKHFCLPAETRNLYYTTEEQIIFGKDFHRRSCHSRDRRYNAAVSEMMNRLTYEQTYQVIQDLTPGNLIWNYINLGVEGTSEGDDVGIFDYFENTGSFLLTGFKLKPWTPIGMTINQLSDKIMDILRNGNY